MRGSTIALILTLMASLPAAPFVCSFDPLILKQASITFAPFAPFRFFFLLALFLSFFYMSPVFRGRYERILFYALCFLLGFLPTTARWRNKHYSITPSRSGTILADGVVFS